MKIQFKNYQNIINQAFDDIQIIAENCGINWNESQHYISDSKNGFKCRPLSKKYAGSVKAWLIVKQLNNGTEYPIINFYTPKHGGISETFNGYQWLVDNNHIKRLPRPATANINKHPVKTNWKVKNNKITPEQPKPLSKAGKKAVKKVLKQLTQQSKKEYQKKLNRFNAFKAEFQNLPIVSKSAYLERKGFSLADIPDNLVLKRGSDFRGDFIAYQLKNSQQHIAGYQKIYDTKCLGNSSNPRDKDFIFYPKDDGTTYKNGSYALLGKIQSHDDLIYVVEGLSTGLSIHAATGSPVAVALDAGNLTHVTSALCKAGYKKIVIPADNDIKPDSTSNAGFIAALKAVRYNKSVKIVYPEYKGQKVDFNDLHQLAGLDEVARQLKKNILFSKKDNLEKWHCLALKYQHEKQLKLTVNKAIGYLVSTLISSEITHTAIYQSAVERGLNPQDLQDKAASFFNQQLEKIKQRHTVTKFNPDDTLDVTGLFDAKDFHQSNFQIAKGLIETGGIIIDPRFMGTGKTELMKVIAELLGHDTYIAYLAHRESLVKGTCTRLGFVSYKEVLAEFGDFAKWLGTCVNSILKFGLTQYKVLFLDEFRQILEHVYLGTCENRQAVISALIEAINGADLVVCADADMNDFTVNWLRENTTQSMSMIKQDIEPHNKIIIELDSETAVLEQAFSDYQNGGSAFISTDSINQSKTIEQFFKNKGIAVEIEALLVHSENKGNTQQAEFLENPNNVSVLYRIAIHSPVISSGVSITNGHFENNYCLFNGVIPPNAMLQTTARNRIAQNIYCSFKPNSKKDRPTNYQDLIDGEILQRKRFVSEKVIQIDIDDFDITRAKLQASINESLNDYRREFLILAGLKGYQYERVQTVTDCTELKIACKESKQKTVNAILESKTITDNNAIDLSKKHNKTQTESNELHKHHALSMAGKNEDNLTPEDISFYINDGSKTVTNNELIKADVTETKKKDRDRLIFKDKPANQTSKAFFIIQLLNVLKDKKNFTGKDLLPAFEFLQSNHKELKANQLGNFEKIPIRPVAKLKSLLEKFGFDVVETGNTKGLRKYSIIENEQVANYVNNRIKLKELEFAEID